METKVSTTISFTYWYEKLQSLCNLQGLPENPEFYDQAESVKQQDYQHSHFRGWGQTRQVKKTTGQITSRRRNTECEDLLFTLFIT